MDRVTPTYFLEKDRDLLNADEALLTKIAHCHISAKTLAEFVRRSGVGPQLDEASLNKVSKRYLIQWLRWRGLIPSQPEKQSLIILRGITQNVLTQERNGLSFSERDPSTRYVDEYTKVSVLEPIGIKVIWEGEARAIEFICFRAQDLVHSNFIEKVFGS